MTLLHYTATVKTKRIIELPEEADILDLEPGQAIDIHLEERAATGASSRLAIDAENAAAIAYLDSKLKRDATDDPEEILKADEEWEELKHNLNVNRASSGERLVF